MFEKERQGQGVLWLHVQELWRLNMAKNQYQEMKERKLNQKT